MPKVPVSDQLVQRKTANVETMRVGSLSQGVVGNNVFEASQSLNSNIAKAGTVFGEIFTRQQEEDKKKKMFTTVLNAQGELDDVLTSPVVDENNVAKGIMNRKLGFANGSVVSYDKAATEISSKFTKDLDDEEKQSFNQAFGTYVRSSRDNVAKHEVNERNTDFENRRSASMDMRIGRASSASSDEALMAEIQGAHLDNGDALRIKGMDNDSIMVANQKLADKMMESNLMSKLENNPDGAKQTLETFKDKISPEFYQKATLQVDGKRFDSMRRSLWDSSFSKMKTSDGEPDLNKIQNSIYASKFPDAQKEKLWDYTKTRASEEKVQKNMYEVADLRSFENQLFGAKKQGATLDEALKLVRGSDNVEIQQREEIVKKLYTNPQAISNPTQYLAVWEKIKGGDATRSDIDVAFAKGDLNPRDYIALRKDQYNSKLTEENKQETLAWTGVKNLATATFGNSKKEKDEYLYAVKRESEGRSPDETAVIAKRLLESHVTEKGLFFDDKEKNYQTVNRQQDAKSEVWGSLKLDVGNDEIKAIGSGILRKGADSWGVSDIENFARPLGGIEAIKKGTPANNAINALIKKGQMVTPENIKAVLKIYADGNY